MPLPHTFLDWVGLIGGLALGLLALRFKTPTSSDRAQLLTKIIEDTAALVVNMTPRATWAQLLKDVVAQALTVSSLPTKNKAAIERAAAAALVKLGKSNPG